MRYTHNFRIIRRHKHRLPLSLLIIGLTLSLIFLFGFTKLDALTFWSGLAESFIRVLISYIFAVIIACCLSLLITKNQQTEDFLLPVLDALQSFPSFSVLPLLMIWFGPTSIAAIIILVIEMIWPLLFSLLTALKQQPGDLLEAAVIFKALGWKRLRYITLPLVFPALITGSIVAWGEAWETVLGVEIIIHLPGVGTYLYGNGQNGQSQILIVGVLMLLSVLFVINKFFWLPLLNKSTRYQQV